MSELRGEQHWGSATVDDPGFAVNLHHCALSLQKCSSHEHKEEEGRENSDTCWNCAEKLRHEHRGSNGCEEDGESAIQPNCQTEGQQRRGKEEKARAV